MADLPSRSRSPGFQRSETSSAELHIYPQETDPVLSLRSPDAGKELLFEGRRRYDELPSLIGISTSKSMGAPSGSWTALVKGGKADLRDLIADDAWVDIHFSRHNRRYFTMRGSVDEIQRTQSASGDGATTVEYVITGRDFGKIYELTPVWFNKYVDSDSPPENVGGAASMRVFSTVSFSGTVDGMVRVYLQEFLQELSGYGRANWQFPASMPGVLQSDRSFYANVGWDPLSFTNDPPRITVPNLSDPNGANVWAMAQEWSDPAFCELFADLSDGDFNNGSDQLSDTSATPVVFLRDRPFPTVELGLDSPWFTLPLVDLPREDVVEDELTRGGAERFNAFFVSPQVLQEYMGNSAIEVTAPLWDERDMREHGFRRFDINSKYQLDVRKVGQAQLDDTLLTLTKAQRERVRDWYCLNPYLWSGSISCGRGVLEARIGRRVRIPGISPSEDFTGYIEAVSHNWRFGQGIRTSLGVTRGWYGTDDEYMRALETVAARYGGNRQGDAIAVAGSGGLA